MFVSADGISKPGSQTFPSCVLSHSARFHGAGWNSLPRAASTRAARQVDLLFDSILYKGRFGFCF